MERVRPKTFEPPAQEWVRLLTLRKRIWWIDRVLPSGLLSHATTVPTKGLVGHTTTSVVVQERVVTKSSRNVKRWENEN